jgi:energy-coupling factor transporter ATP-binding protein EcfA2
MVEPVTTSLIAIESAAKLYRIAEDEGFVKRLANFFKHTETIIVLGSTGSGKTNLLDSLAVAAALVEPIPATTRTQTTERRRVVVNERPFVIIDTPGQREHGPQRQSIYREALARPPVRLINVVSFGYHEYATGSGEAVDGSGAARDDWLERHRENELTAMREWLPLLGDRNTASWILTAVTKADLWWNERDAVLAYYGTGPYAKELKSQDPGLKHSVLPYSSVFHRFYGEAALAGTFDDEDRLETTGHFLQQLVALG